MRVFAPLLLLLSFDTSAEIYKWLDEQGVRHYSNEPHEGAEKLPLLTQEMIGQPVASNASTAQNIVQQMHQKEQIKLRKKLRSEKVKTSGKDG